MITSFLLSFFTIASLHFLAVISPGPDYVLVTGNALAYNRRIAIYTALGIALGIIVHASYCLFGLAIVIKQSLLLFNIIKLLGGVYLLYIGIKACLAKNQKTVTDEQPFAVSAISAGQAIKQGFLCNVLNPKATLFFLGVFTLVIKPSTPWGVQVFYALWMMAATFAWFSSLATFITHSAVRARIWRIQPLLTKIMGALLIIFGLNLLLFIKL